MTDLDEFTLDPARVRIKMRMLSRYPHTYAADMLRMCDLITERAQASGVIERMAKENDRNPKHVLHDLAERFITIQSSLLISEYVKELSIKQTTEEFS